MTKAFRIVLLAVLVLTGTSTFARIGDEEIKNLENSLVIHRVDNSDLDVSLPGMVFTFTDAEITLKFRDPQHPKLQLNNNELGFIVNGTEQKVKFTDGVGVITHRFNSGNHVTIYCEDFSFESRVSAYPAWIFVVPVAFMGIWVARGRFTKKKKA
jgi:hypothetical protein